MLNYYVNGSLTNLAQGTIGFSAYQGSVVLAPTLPGDPWIIESPNAGQQVIGYNAIDAEAYVRGLLRSQGMYPVY
jgi:hypothetical protein